MWREGIAPEPEPTPEDTTINDVAEQEEFEFLQMQLSI
jgi:hypothetical protein